MIEVKKHRTLSYPAYIAIGFFILIFTGALLLTLPISSKNGEFTNFLDAFFTATSASCVTGLIIADTYVKWTVFGQLVILSMIQIGGLGFMTVITMFSLFFKRKIGLKERGLLQESISTMYIGGIVRLMKRILLGTLIFEEAGAIILALRFIPRMGLKSGIYCGIFHSVSAFCNAGFDLLGRYGECSSLTTFQSDPVVCITIGCLIVIGGIGFLVWDDIAKEKYHFKNYQLHTKLALTVTGILILGGTIVLFFFERNNTIAGMSLTDGVVNSFFGAVTPRTAGFNSVDTASLTDASKFFTIILMFIGGSPGSTAGGIKTTTLAVLFVTLRATLRGSDNNNVFGRRLQDNVLKRASAVICINTLLSFAAVLIISSTNAGIGLVDIIFEVFSAMGTVGMSTGITRSIDSIAKAVLIFLMYCGRVGSLSFAILFIEKKSSSAIQKPTEKIIIG